MLSKPDIGWTVFSLGGFQAEISYLTDIPFEWLISCKTELEHNIPASFFLELEGESCIVTAYGHTHIICENHDCEHTLITVRDVDFAELTRMLLHDIRLYFDDWVRWYAFEEKESDFARRAPALKELIEETEQALRAYLAKAGRR